MDKSIMTAAIERVAKEHGVDCEVSCTSSSFIEVEFKVAFRAKGAMSRDQSAWDARCRYYDLQPHHFGAEFVSRGQTYRITGINTRAPKYPIKGVRVRDGAGFKFPADHVRRLLPPDPPAPPAPEPTAPIAPRESLGGGDW